MPIVSLLASTFTPELEGFDLTNQLDYQTGNAVAQALAVRPVLIFPNQDTGNDQ